MGAGDRSGHAQRDQTDESLQVERDRADGEVSKRTARVEEDSDEVLQLARTRADELVQKGRAEADRERPASSVADPSAELATERERGRADVLLERERSSADATLEYERAERKRFLDEFLAAEREATDQDLLDERAHSDTVIAARDEFLATVSHDLRGLLNTLSINATLVINAAPDGPAGERLRKHAGSSQRVVGRMSRMINDLLDITSIEAGVLHVVAEPIEVAELLRDTVDAFASVAAARQLTFDAEPLAVPLVVRLDGGRILQVLANLVSNAIKFTPAGGQLRLRAGREGDELRFALSDTGIGLAEADLLDVFEWFRQVSKNRHGLGLGLHISKCIVEAHGGRMWAERNLGPGATFHVALPGQFQLSS